MTTPSAKAQAKAAGFTARRLAPRRLVDDCALVLSPGVPLTHPEPHWSVALARAAGVAGDRRHRAVLPRARRSRAQRAVRRDHRDQRQVDHDRAHRSSSGLRRPRRADRRQYRHARSCRSRRRRPGRCTSSRSRPTRLISRPRSIRPSASSSMSARIISIAMARSRTMRRSRSGWWRACRRAAPRRRRRRQLVPGCRNRLERAGKSVVRGLGAPPARRRALCRGRADHAARPAARRARSRNLGRSARCAARTMRRTPRCASGAALALGVAPAVIQQGLGRFLASRIGWRRSVARGGCSSSTIPKRPTRIRLRRRSPASPIFSGSPAASPRPAALYAHGLLPAHAQGLSDRRGGGGLRG